MPNARLLVLFLLIAWGAAIGAQTDHAATIARMELDWNAAHIRGDAAALGAIFADDLVVVVPGMRPMSKADSLGVFATGRMTFERYETSDTTPRVNERPAVATGRLQRARRRGERAVSDDW